MIKVVSFNILAENCIDFLNSSKYYPNVPIKQLYIKNRLPTIIQNLYKYDADIILLQEVTMEVREILVDKLCNYIVLDFDKHDLGLDYKNQYGNLTILKKNIFQNIHHECQYLYISGTAYSITNCTLHPEEAEKEFLLEENGCSQPFSEAPRASADVNDNKMIIVNVHYEDENIILRRNESNALLDYITPFINDYKIIIGGDFNTENPILHKKYDKFESVIDKTKSTSTYLNENYMIDYIYVHGFKVKSSYVDNQLPCGWQKESVQLNCIEKIIKYIGSDHYPVIAEIE